MPWAPNLSWTQAHRHCLHFRRLPVSARRILCCPHLAFQSVGPSRFCHPPEKEASLLAPGLADVLIPALGEGRGDRQSWVGGAVSVLLNLRSISSACWRDGQRPSRHLSSFRSSQSLFWKLVPAVELPADLKFRVF